MKTILTREDLLRIGCQPISVLIGEIYLYADFVFSIRDGYIDCRLQTNDLETYAKIITIDDFISVLRKRSAEIVERKSIALKMAETYDKDILPQTINDIKIKFYGQYEN